MNRRTFLRSLGAFAALAVAPTTLKALSVDDNLRLIEMMKTGLVENQTFVLTRPISFALAHDLEIRQCMFHCRFDYRLSAIEDWDKASRVLVHDNVFHFRGDPVLPEPIDTEWEHQPDLQWPTASAPEASQSE